MWIILDIFLFILYKSVDFCTSASIYVVLFHFGTGLLLRVVGAIGAFEVLNKIASSINWDGLFFSFYIRRGMVVYLIHQQFIYYTLCWLAPYTNPYINAFVNFVFALSASLFFASLVLSNKITALLFGEKISLKQR